jgi:hypothetical protein
MSDALQVQVRGRSVADWLEEVPFLQIWPHISAVFRTLLQHAPFSEAELDALFAGVAEDFRQTLWRGLRSHLGAREAAQEVPS